MKIGVSTASLYPLHTEDAFRKVAELGIEYTELFLNSLGEGEGEIFEDIINTAKKYGTRILSLHPFSSPMESLFLFSTYDRRVNDILDIYKRYFNSMNEVSAKIFILHGAISSSGCPDDLYVQQFGLLNDTAKKFGITIAQENISYCKSRDIEFLKYLSQQLKDDVHFVIDIKQARRSGLTAFQLKEAIGDKVVHYHLSDAAGEKDCLPVGKGEFDFAKLFTELKRDGYKGDAVVELYRSNYGEYSELKDSVELLKQIEKNS